MIVEKQIIFSIALFTPFVSFLLSFTRMWRLFSVLGTLISFIVSIPLLKGPVKKTITLSETVGFKINLLSDGLSSLMIFLTTFLTFLVVIHALGEDRERKKEYVLCYLFLEGVLVWAFSTTNLLGFYFFFDAMLIPMFIIIGVWGSGRRVYSAFKFAIFTFSGSIFFLVAVVYLGFEHYQNFALLSFDIENIRKVIPLIPERISFLLFLAFLLAFFVKVPIVPLHVWLPDAHTEAPTGGSVILAGVLLKLGSYAFLRFAIPLFPQFIIEHWMELSILAVVSIIFGAFLALSQKDMKRLIAYSSVSHMGYVMLGMFVLNKGILTVEGLSGAILQMINHGLATGMLFFIIGMLYSRKHTRLISDYGGIAPYIPYLTFFFFVSALSSIGFPSTGGFVGELLIILGALKGYKLFGVLCATGVILSAGYLLWAGGRMFFGPVKEKNRDITDIKLYEFVVLLPITILIFWIGIYPKTFLDIIGGFIKG